MPSPYDPQDPPEPQDHSPPESVALLWGHDERDGIAVKGHGHAPETLHAAAAENGYSAFTTASELWICQVPDRTGKFDSKWVEVTSSNARARAWTMLEGLTVAPIVVETGALDGHPSNPAYGYTDGEIT
jgi:hypothetical protein